MPTPRRTPPFVRGPLGQGRGALLLLGLLGACTSGPAPRPAQREASESPAHRSAPPEEPPVTDPLVPPAHGQEPAARTPIPPLEPGSAVADDPNVTSFVVASQQPPSPPDTLAEPAGAVPDAHFVGRFRISGSIPSQGGAIGWSREYELRADHTFQMSAYPPLAASGTWRRMGTEGARAELVHDTLRAPDGGPRLERVRGLAHPGEPLSVLEIDDQRFPRVVETP